MNCLRRGHFSSACWKKRRCESCGEKHHPLLHQSDSTSARAPTPAQATAPAPSGDSSAAPSSRTVFRTACDDKKVALQIVPINVTAGGKSATTLGLLDPGSEGTFVSKALAERLAAKPKASERITLSRRIFQSRTDERGPSSKRTRALSTAGTKFQCSGRQTLRGCQTTSPWRNVALHPWSGS